MTRMLKTTIFAAGLLSAVAAQGAAAGGYGYEDGHYAHHSYASQYGYHNTYYESHYYSSHHAYHDPYTYHRAIVTPSRSMDMAPGGTITTAIEAGTSRRRPSA